MRADTRVRLLFVGLLVLGLGLSRRLDSESLTMTTSYPAPSGVYLSLVTTGGNPGSPVNTLLARDAGNVGIATTYPDQKLTVSGNVGLTGVLVSSGTGSSYFAGKITSPKTFQAGTAAIDGSGGFQTVTFPTAFNTVPIVIANMSSKPMAGDFDCYVVLNNITTTSFQFYCINTFDPATSTVQGSIHTGPDPINWMAFAP